MNESVASIINDILTKLKFERKRDHWYKHLDEVVQLVGLQKSGWGKQYYLNLGIWVNQIERREFPKIPGCHIQCRIDAISEECDDIHRALDEEDLWKMDMNDRRETLELALCGAEFLFFRELNSFDSVSRYLKRGDGINCAVTQSLREII